MANILGAKTLINKSNLTKEQWLEWRRKGIGGSDAAAILGLHTYSSAYSVYCDKKGLLSEIPDNEAMRQGRDLEEYVASRFREATDKKTKNCNFMLQHKKYEFIIGDVDRLIVGENAGLECKTTSVYNKTDFEGGNVPPEYYIQCLHYMAVTGAERWYLAILVLNRGFHWFCIDRSDPNVKEDIERLIEREIDFWQNNVIANIEPIPDGSKRASEVIKSIYVDCDYDSEVDLTLYEFELKQYFALKEKINELQREQDKIAQTIQAYMQSAGRGKSEVGNVLWLPRTSTRIDTKALKTEQADLYNKYSKTTTSRYFIVKEAN